MAFQLRFHEDSSTGLVAVCDVCGEIAKGDDGLIVWAPDDGEKPGDYITFKIVCKGPCDRMNERMEGMRYSQGLDVALVYLANNTEVNFKEASRMAGILSRLG